MTSYQNTIIDLLQGDTPKAKHDYLVALMLDRDQFAIGFVEWADKNHWRYNYQMKWWYNDRQSQTKTHSELLALYKPSLTKTDKK